MTRDQIEYIKNNALTRSDAEIAQALGVAEITIAKYRVKLGLRKNKLIEKHVEKKNKNAQKALLEQPFEMLSDTQKDNYCELKLVNSPEWQILRKGLSVDEQQQFKVSWVKYYLQFNAEVTATEETQILQLINYEVMISRSLVGKREFMAKLERNKKIIEAERKLPPAGQDLSKIMELEQENLQLLQLQVGTSKEYMDLQGRHRQVLLDLKGTRDQRIKQLEEKTNSFFALVKYVQSRHNQEKESRYMELAKKAMFMENDRFTELHDFADGAPDRIFLTPEGMDLEDKAKEQNE